MANLQGSQPVALLALGPAAGVRRVFGIPFNWHTDPNRYTQEHLRRAELLSIPAAAAIQNARLFARADIYASELEKRLIDLREAETALAEAQGDRQLSGDKFQKVFRGSPIPFSITTLNEGRFVDVNAAFERRYGYPREELLGRTVHELRMWCDPADRMFMIEQLHRGIPVRNVITWLRTKSGEVKLTAYLPTESTSTANHAFSPSQRTCRNTIGRKPIRLTKNGRPSSIGPAFL